ncbi:MAG: caspase family protein [Gemmatimonadota bacterium]
MHATVLALSLAFAGPAHSATPGWAAHPQQAWERYVEAQLDLSALGLGSLAARRVWSETGSLAAGTSAYFQMRPEPGITYTLQGVCDERCDDLDLRVTGLEGAVVGRDGAPDAVPLVHFNLGDAGPFEVQVTMVGCLASACRFGVALYEAGPSEARARGTPAPSEGAAPTDTGVSLPWDGRSSLRGRLLPDQFFHRIDRAFAKGDHLDALLRSSEFHPYLAAVSPSGRWWVGDASEAGGSRLSLEVDEPGTWRLFLASRLATESGAYVFEAAPAPGSTTGFKEAPTVLGAQASGGGSPRVFGVFVGISDYPGNGVDLPYTSADASRTLDAMRHSRDLDEAGQALFTDDRATRRSVLRAVRRLSAAAGPDDTFVFFFSGHGVQVPAPRAQASDPDGLDEALMLHDGPLLDDELAEALAEAQAGAIVVILDACYSGGFAKDVISRPGRLGIFSSEEHVTSQVAAEYRAGGYLSEFVFDGVGKRAADQDGDGALTATELLEYLHERYRRQSDLSHQHLVVDRGSVAGERVLFR